MRALILSCTLLLFTTDAGAYSLLGGRTLGVRDSALHVQVGYPQIDMRYHIPILKEVEVIPRVTLYYSAAFLGAGLRPGDVGSGFGANGRMRLLEEGDLFVAYGVELLAFFNFDPFVSGARLGLPGSVIVGYEISPSIALSASLNIPLTVVWHPVTMLVVPLEFSLGAEIAVTDRVNLSVVFTGGPAVVVPKQSDDVKVDDSSYVGPIFQGMIGVEYLM